MKNVAILMQSRTGSSLVAATFRAHGWETKAERVRTRNYTTHENQAIKTHLMAKYGRALREPTPRVPADHELWRIVQREFRGAPWAWKGDVFYIEAFLATFKDLALIYVKRAIPDAVKSSLDHRSFPIDGKGRPYHEALLEEFLRRKYRLMDALKAQHGGVIVDTTAVMEGNLSSLQEAVDYAGGEFDPARIREVMRKRG